MKEKDGVVGVEAEVVSPIKREPEDPNKITTHHRKPTSIGGGEDQRNKSAVRMFKHRAWHALYVNWTAEEISSSFEEDYEIFGADVLKTPLLKMLHEGWANSTDQRISRSKAWFVLFAQKTLQQVVLEINTRWIDPDYQLDVETRRKLVTRLRRVNEKSVQYAYS